MKQRDCAWMYLTDYRFSGRFWKVKIFYLQLFLLAMVPNTIDMIFGHISKTKPWSWKLVWKRLKVPTLLVSILYPYTVIENQSSKVYQDNWFIFLAHFQQVVSLSILFSLLFLFLFFFGKIPEFKIINLRSFTSIY